MDATELAFAGIARQAELIRDRDLSSRELVQLYLDRVERLDPELNSFRVVLADSALAEAERVDSSRSAAGDRPLAGVPIAVKDLVDVRGEVTSHGTACFDRPASVDADLVRRLRDAGAIIIGKTNLPELAIYGFTESAAWGVTRNPWRTDRTAGGSSGGSGAAVAAGLVGGATASDGAGSIRIPAASCGLFGLKPQRGRISLGPDVYVERGMHWHGMSVSGCLTRTVLDTAIFLDATVGPAADDPAPPPPPRRPFAEAARTAPGRLRIAWSALPPRLLVPPAKLAEPSLEALEDTARLLRSLGHATDRREADFGSVGTQITAMYLNGIHEDVVRTPNPDRLEPRTRGLARLGAVYSGPLVRRAMGRASAHASRINRIFDECDVFMTLVSRVPPVRAGRWAGQGALRTLVGMSRVYPYNVVWNYLGNPAASVPAGFSPDGLPLSVQLVAPPNREDVLISLAAQIESERRWFEHRPPLAG
jgi:amidase